jgi:hypothetical protein
LAKPSVNDLSLRAKQTLVDPQGNFRFPRHFETIAFARPLTAGKHDLQARA